MNNRMVVHKWAHGITGKGKNLTTDGKTLTSYKTTVAWNTGRGLVFIASDSLTPTTGKQVSLAYSAASHLDRIMSPIFEYGYSMYDFNENKAYKMACEALNDQLVGLGMARLSAHLHSRMEYAWRQMDHLTTLGTKYQFDAFEFTSIPEPKIAAARDYASRGTERALRREANSAVAVKARRELDRDQFNAWHAPGGSGTCPTSFQYDEQGCYYTAVRGDVVVTSGGAECPIDHARKAVSFWLSRKFAGATCRVCWDAASLNECEHDGPFTPWTRNGHSVKLGVFQLDRIDEQGNAYAGCHKFSCSELDRLAAILL